MPPAVYDAVLSPHPQTRDGNVRAIEVRLARSAAVLAFTYTMLGDLTRLRMPATGVPKRSDELWRHTCFEAFIADERRNDYYELNFSPSRQWAIYYFERYRERGPLVDVPAAEIGVEQGSDSFRLDAKIDVGALAHLKRDGLTIALAAVVEDNAGALSYWALRHPPGKPDFHHPDGFALKLSAEVEKK